MSDDSKKPKGDPRDLSEKVKKANDQSRKGGGRR